MGSSREAVIKEHFNELVREFPFLSLSEDYPGRWVVRGHLKFKAEYESTIIEDSFKILLKLPPDYPVSPPIAYETGGRIPRDFHKLGDGSLCLGARFEVKQKFSEDPRLLHFVTNQLVNYFFCFCYWQEYGKMPYGERSHSGLGILESYSELLNVSDHLAVLYLLTILAEGTYRGHHLCPCGSTLKLRKCHLKQLQAMGKVQLPGDFLDEVMYTRLTLPKGMVESLPKDLLQRLVLRHVNYKT